MLHRWTHTKESQLSSHTGAVVFGASRGSEIIVQRVGAEDGRDIECQISAVCDRIAVVLLVSVSFKPRLQHVLGHLYCRKQLSGRRMGETIPFLISRAYTGGRQVLRSTGAVMLSAT
jgi:hypothetical protein